MMAPVDVPRELTLAEIEAWLAGDDPIIPDDARATCPRCNGWGVDPRHARCAVCMGTCVVSMGEWRRDLRERIAGAVN